MAFLRLCTESIEHAIHVSSDTGAYEKQSWLQRRKTDDDDDAAVVRTTNDYFLDTYGDAKILDDFFNGAVDRDVQPIYLTDNNLVLPEQNKIIAFADMHFVIAQRLSSYSTKTFDLNIFMDQQPKPFTIENIDRKDFKKIREWYPCPIYTWGEDKFQPEKILYYVNDKKMPLRTLFTLLGFYSFDDMDSIVHIKERDQKTWEDILTETVEDDDEPSDDEWVPGDDDDCDTEIDEYQALTEEEEDEVEEEDEEEDEDHVSETQPQKKRRISCQ